VSLPCMAKAEGSEVPGKVGKGTAALKAVATFRVAPVLVALAPAPLLAAARAAETRHEYGGFLRAQVRIRMRAL
jgi:hypothetical protein